jgi:uncharacterized membrane protein YgaE (UPF0421/DUF939 family)
MSEREAIKSLKEFAYTIHGTLSAEEAKIVLNLIEKLQKANKELDNDNTEWRAKYVIQLAKIDDLQKENKNITQQRDYYKARYNELSKIVDSMAKHIYILGDYACLYEERDDNMDRECEDCIKEYFYKKVKETKDNGNTRNV